MTKLRTGMSWNSIENDTVPETLFPWLGMKPACLGCSMSSAQQERVMNPAALRRTVIAAVALGCVAIVARPALTEERLTVFNADIRESSVSGISSGAFMAVQFATAW